MIISNHCYIRFIHLNYGRTQILLLEPSVIDVSTLASSLNEFSYSQRKHSVFFAASSEINELNRILDPISVGSDGSGSYAPHIVIFTHTHSPRLSFANDINVAFPSEYHFYANHFCELFAIFQRSRFVRFVAFRFLSTGINEKLLCLFWLSTKLFI